MNKVTKALQSFVPKEYYETVADFYGISIVKYPYYQTWYDDTVGRKCTWAIYDFFMPTVQGQKVAMITIVYRSLYSNHKCKRDVFLNNMSPICQPPHLSSYRPQEEE